ncbi:hypothetical protein BDZ45DRAFT_676383 [Acephala macrosclerotiorum]|nr:hypothetical protein BDZ45DRAFT_676383 [Acephala macrosclerotiorum]
MPSTMIQLGVDNSDEGVLAPLTTISEHPRDTSGCINSFAKMIPKMRLEILIATQATAINLSPNIVLIVELGRGNIFVSRCFDGLL